MPIHNEYLTLSEFIKTIFVTKLHWNNHLWYLQALAVIYMFFPLIKSTYANNIKGFYFFLIIAFVLTFGNVLLFNGVSILQAIIGKVYITERVNFFSSFNAFKGILGYSIVYFMIGGLLFRFKEKFQPLNRNRVLSSVMVVLFGMGLLTLIGISTSKNINQEYDIVWNGYDTIPTLFMVFALFSLTLKYKGTHKFSKIINLIGKNTLGIYFIHRIWGELFIPYFKHFAYSNNIIINIFFDVIILILSLVIVHLLRKIPIVNNLFQI